MADFDFTQTGQEIQDILNGAAMQTDLTEEANRAKAAEQELQGNIDDINAVIPNGASHNNKLVTHDDMESEVGDLQQADSTLQGNIDAEELRAKAAEEANADAIDRIESMIPAEASSENKLADKNFVTSSIATSTAQYRGSFNQVSDLHLTLEATTDDVAAALEGAIDTADNNDYCFVQVPDSEREPINIAHIDRYKFNGTSWTYEYTLNNSGFTAAQWEAINSSITSGLVGKLSDLPTNAELITLLAGKQNTLTFDTAPTFGSNNPVTSGGVKIAINDEKERAQAAEGTNADNIAQVISMIPSGASANNKLTDKDYVDAADSSMQTAIEGILALIPQAATALNQLADKAFVNSSIATNTGTFKGTYNVVSDLQLFYNATHAQIAIMLASTIEAADNNDYCYVQVPNSNEEPTSINHTDRYKFNGSSWDYEYTLNNSGFTADQWGAINSGITQELVTSLTNLLTNLVPPAASVENKLTDQAYVIAAIVAAIPACKGQFTTLADLEAVPSSKAGDLGIVRTSGTDGYPVFSFYQYKDGAWTTFFVLDNYYQLNKPAANNLSLATFDNGMGKYEIPKHIVNIGTELEPIYQNQLYQTDFYDTNNQPRTNTIFVIKYDFTLAQDITIPANCVLEFNGGSVSGGIIISNNTQFIGHGFGNNILLQGTLFGNICRFDWWKYDLSQSVTAQMQAALDSSVNTGSKLFISNGTYLLTYISGKYCLNTTHSVDILGESMDGTIIKTVKNDLTNTDGSQIGYKGLLYILVKEENLSVNIHNITLDGTHDSVLNSNINEEHKAIGIFRDDYDFLIYNLTYFNASNVTVKNFEGEAFWTSAYPVAEGKRATQKFKVENCKFINVGGSSGNLGAHVTYKNCLFDYANIEAAYGWPDMPGEFVADSCIFKNRKACLTVDNQGITDNLNSITGRICIITNCLFENSKEFLDTMTSGSAVTCIGLSAIERVKIENNTFINAGKNIGGDSGGSSILFKDALFKNVAIKNNTFIITYDEPTNNIITPELIAGSPIYDRKVFSMLNNSVMATKKEDLNTKYDDFWIELNIQNVRLYGARTIIKNLFKTPLDYEITIQNISDESITFSYMNLPLCAYGTTVIAPDEIITEKGISDIDITVAIGGLTEITENGIKASVRAKMFVGKILSGTSDERPITNVKGLPYFDTTLGKIIYCNGISSNIVAWVDATGATV